MKHIDIFQTTDLINSHGIIIFISNGYLFNYSEQIRILTSKKNNLNDFHFDFPYIIENLNENGSKCIFNELNIESFIIERASNYVFNYPFLYFFSYDENYNKQFFSKYDLKSKQILFTIEGDFSRFYHFNNLIFLLNKNKTFIEKIQSNSHEFLWQYTLPEGIFDYHVYQPFGGPTYRKAEVRKMLGVHQNILWVVLNSGFLLGIDAEKGVLVYTINKINSYLGKAPIYPQQPDVPQENWGKFFTNNLQLDSGRGLLFGLKDSYYIEIDLSDPLNNYTVYEVSETMQAHQIEADMATSEWAWEGDELFFGKNFSGGNNLGIFNRASKQVTWATRVLNEKGGVESFNKIEYSSGRLYALTQKTNTLYVFEKVSF